MKFKNFSLKYWWYGLVEDLHKACSEELHTLEMSEINKGHDLLTQKEHLPDGWHSLALETLGIKGNIQVLGPYQCIWESPQHRAIRAKYAGKIFQRRISFLPSIVGVIGGLLGIAAFVMQCIKC